MKKACKLLSIIVSAVMLVGVFTSCKSCEEEEKKSTVTTEDSYNLHTTHGGKAEPMSLDWLVQNGSSAYKIVRSATASSDTNWAAGMLQDFFNRATGITLPIVTDDAVSYSDEAKLISLGDNAVQAAANVQYDTSELTSSGFIIKTVGKSIFLCGGKHGEAYSVYELLKYLFDFEYYAEDCYSLNTSVTELNLYDFDVKEIPDIMYRSALIGASTYTTDAYYQKSVRTVGGFSVGENNHPWHNTLEYVPYDEYGSTHPEWFSTEISTLTNVGGYGLPGQLCYTRDPDGYLPIVVEKIKKLIETTDEEITHFTFVQQDCTPFCACASCKEAEEKYGGKAGAYIAFVNKIGNAIAEWQKTSPYKDRLIKIMGMSYVDTEQAPVKYENGVCLPIDEAVDCPDNVEIVIAQSGDKYYALNTDINKDVYIMQKEWSAVCDHLMFWTYPIRNFGNYFQFSDVYNALQEDYKHMVSCGATWNFPQGAYNQRVSTAFQTLTGYLVSKLQWDCQVDLDAAMDGFFKNYFGAAEEPMRKLFDAHRARMAYCVNSGVISASTYNLLTGDIYLYALLRCLDEYIDEAYKAIESLKETDETLYDVLYDRICLESLCTRFIDIELWSKYYTAEELLAEKVSFKADCIRLRVDRHRESVTVESLWESWGIA